MIFTIAMREFKSLFLTPLAWVILAFMQFILSFFFAKGISDFLLAQPQIQANHIDIGITTFVNYYLYYWAVAVIMLVVPLLTMRAFSEEKRNATMPLLLSAPLGLAEIVLGKYLGLIMFNLLLAAMLTLMPLSVLIGGTLDWGMLLLALTGLILATSCYSAIGIFISSLTRSPVLAAVITYLVLFFLFVIDLLATSQDPSGLFQFISLRKHIENLMQGLFSREDITYYLLIIITFVVLTIRRLESERI